MEGTALNDSKCSMHTSNIKDELLCTMYVVYAWILPTYKWYVDETGSCTKGHSTVIFFA